jgi:hypothetical protein
MKNYLVIYILFCSTYVFCQTPLPKVTITDSVKIVYESSKRLQTEGKQPFYYVEGKLWHANAISAIDLENIKDLNVYKNSSRYGEVHITLKDPGKVANLTFLSQEIEKHLGKNDTPTIYMIDNEFLKDDLNTYKIKENYILRIEVMTADDIASLKPFKLKLTVVNIVTKSPKNMEEAKKIYIRGNSVNSKKI